MCGIVGYVGMREAYPILIKGLKRLEYRGYDSAGVAIINNNQNLNVYKAKGKVSELEAYISDKDVSGTIGIAHTRWATHGEPCKENAHPHYSSSENIALIHNGIIENYAVLKNRLQEKGYTFKSSTDTEVLVQLIEYIKVSKDLDLLTAVQLALREVIGAYAIAVLDKERPSEIIAARKSSPLVVGIGDNEFFLASDATPIVEYTDKVVYLEDEEIALIRYGEDLKVVNIQNVSVTPEIQTVALNIGQLEKGGYPHFMLKEIFEQPNCIRDCMRGRINVEGTNVVLSAIIDHKEKLLKAKRFIIVARGWMRKGMRTKLEASLVSVTTKIYLVSQTPVFWRNTFFGAGLFSWMLDVLSLSARYRKELPLLLSGGRLLLVCTWISDSGIFAMSILSEGKDLNH